MKILILVIVIAFLALVIANPIVTSDEKKHLRSEVSKAATDFYSWNIRKDLEKYLLSKIKGGGATCAACDIFLSTFISYSNVNNISASQFLWQTWCNMFSGAVQTGCNVLVQIIGPDVEQWMNEGQTPDQMCANLGLCNQPECKMFPSTFVLNEQLRESALKSQSTSFFSLKDLESDVKADWDKVTQVNLNELEGSLNPFGWFKTLINSFASGHLAVLDLDKDKFGGDQAVFRGYNWRGKDCDDTNANVYPGRKTSSEAAGVDYNCNGILGLDANGNEYKDTFCKNSGQIGVAVLGDSAGAHFQIPPKWMNASLMTSDTYHDLLTVGENEVDLPHMSAYTGFVQSTPNNLVNSIYQMLYQRNRCNFRDYQNLAVNGGRAGNTINNMDALKRDQQNDYPLLVFLELIGNDVCSSNPTGWTSTTDFKKNILTILDKLNATLPKGSHVFIYGLAQGTVLYEYMGNRMHPLGVPYSAVYDFLNCLGKSPCAGWMNTNATIRQNTQNHADELNQVYRDIIAEGYTWANFDYDYFDFAFEKILKDYEAAGGQPWELIEACDGFHPSQTANYFLANVTWNLIQQNHPDWLGNVNPYNDQIDQLFGDQGGY